MDIDTLSNDAKYLLASHFMPLLENGQVVFHTPSRIKPRAKAAFDELVASGAISIEHNDAGSAIYRAIVDCTPLDGWMEENPSEGKFRIVDTSGPAGTIHFATERPRSTIRAADKTEPGIDPSVLKTLFERASFPEGMVTRVSAEIAFLTDPAANDVTKLTPGAVTSFLAFSIKRRKADWSSLGISDAGHVLAAWFGGEKMLTASFGDDVNYAYMPGNGWGIVNGRMSAQEFATVIDDFLSQMELVATSSGPAVR